MLAAEAQLMFSLDFGMFRRRTPIRKNLFRGQHSPAVAIGRERGRVRRRIWSYCRNCRAQKKRWSALVGGRIAWPRPRLTATVCVGWVFSLAFRPFVAVRKKSNKEPPSTAVALDARISTIVDRLGSARGCQTISARLRIMRTDALACTEPDSEIRVLRLDNGADDGRPCRPYP